MSSIRWTWIPSRRPWRCRSSSSGPAARSLDLTTGADDLRYSEEHLWLRRRAGAVCVGVTEQISRVLTWVTQVDLAPPSTRLDAGDQLVTIDSQKAVIVLAAPVALTVVTVNDALFTDPMLVRMDPHGRGWLVEVSLQASGWERLLTPDEYRRVVTRS